MFLRNSNPARVGRSENNLMLEFRDALLVGGLVSLLYESVSQPAGMGLIK